MPDVSYRTMSLKQFGFGCGHCQNQFRQILICSNAFQNLSFAGLGPELSKKKLSVQFWKLSSPCRRPMCLDADFMTFLKTAWFWVWCQMHPIKQCPWDSLGFGVVMATSSSVKYMFLAILEKTYHLQVWAQSCPKNKPSWRFWKLFSLCWRPVWLHADFFTF